jgi:hypothetical protein
MNALLPPLLSFTSQQKHLAIVNTSPSLSEAGITLNNKSGVMDKLQL